MRGRRKGDLTIQVLAKLNEEILLGTPGITFQVEDEWGGRRRKLGTLTVSVDGVWWRPRRAKNEIRMSWQRFVDRVEE